jgi:predicted dehydrogenase
MKKLVRYGVIGFGAVAETRIVKEGFALDRRRFSPPGNVSLAGVTDISKARGRAAEALGLKWFDSAERMLDSSEIDAVIIASDNASHYPLAMAAMERGKHCLVEKPMAVSMDEAETLRRTARKAGVSLSVDHCMKHNSFNVLARRMTESGGLGAVNDICLHMELPFGATKAEAKSWRCANPENLGGPVADLGSHCFYMAEYLLGGVINTVASVYYPRTLDIGVECGAHIKFWTDTGISGSVRVSFAEQRGGLFSAWSNLGYEVYGSEGALRSYAAMCQFSGHPDEPARVRLELETPAEAKALSPEKIPTIYQSVIASHADSVISGSYDDGLEGVRNLRLVLAAHESARKNGEKVWITREY